MNNRPACCTPSPNAGPAELAYCAYNAAGDPETAGRNFRGDPCPVWADLPPNVRAKWEGVAALPDMQIGAEARRVAKTLAIPNPGLNVYKLLLMPFDAKICDIGNIEVTIRPE